MAWQFVLKTALIGLIPDVVRTAWDFVKKKINKTSEKKPEKEKGDGDKTDA